MRRILLAVMVALLLLLAWTGLSGGMHDIRVTENLGQKVQAVAQLGYGLLSLLTVTTIHATPRWRRVVRGCWAASVTVAAGLAAVVWGDEGVVVGLVAAAGGLLIALVILWLLRTGARRANSA